MAGEHTGITALPTDASPSVTTAVRSDLGEVAAAHGAGDDRHDGRPDGTRRHATDTADTTTTTRSARPTLRESLRVAWLPWLLSRIVVDVAIVASISHLWRDFELRYRGFVMFDFGWYHQIAVAGYGPAPSSDTVGEVQTPWPFFPLYPGVLKLGRAVGLNDQIVGVVVNHLVLLLALAGLHRITSRLGGADAGRLAVWALACFPASFVFSMGYPSAIFLCASVWAFELVDERRFALAGWCGAVAALIRPNGFLVAGALGLGLLARAWSQRRHADPAAAETGTTETGTTETGTVGTGVVGTGVVRPLALAVGPAVVGVGAWLAYLWHRTGDPFVFIAAKAAWDEISIVEALTRSYAKFVGAHLVLGVAAFAAVALALVRRYRLPWPWLVFMAAYLLPPFAVGLVGLGRYSNECFVPFVAAGMVMARWRRPAVVALLVCGSALTAVYAVQVVRFLWVP
jgi:hypothetical protein